MTNLPTPWQQFYNSRFRYRPPRKIQGWWVTSPKTNKAKWAKQ